MKLNKKTNYFYIIIALLIVVILLIVSAIFKTDIIIKGQGKITTKQIIKEQYKTDNVFIKTGELVVKGESLLTVSKKHNQKLEYLKNQLFTINNKKAKINAIINNKKPAWISPDNKKQSKLLKNLKRKYWYEKNIKITSQNIANSKIKQKMLKLNQLNHIYNNVKTQSYITKKIYENEELLCKRNMTTNNNLLNTQKIYLQNSNQIKVVAEQIKKAKEEIKEIKQRQIKKKLMSENKMHNKKEQIIKQIIKTKNKIKTIKNAPKQIIYAPVDGLIKQLKQNKDAIVLEIIPIKNLATASIQINSKDAKYIKVGQTANIKIKIPDSKDYGMLKGIVKEILYTKNNNFYYNVIVELEDIFVQTKQNKTIMIMPDMPVSASINVNSVTLLESIFN